MKTDKLFTVMAFIIAVAVVALPTYCEYTRWRAHVAIINMENDQ